MSNEIPEDGPSARNGATPPDGNSSSGRVGEILAGMGRLSAVQVATVLERQERDGRLFGELANLLGYVSLGDVELALSKQHSATQDDVLVEFPRASAAPFIDTADLGNESLVAVQSQLVHRWFGEDVEQRALAVVSTDRGDGRSYVCSRLACLFADLDEDTLIIDADLRNPSMHRIFGADNSVGLSSYLQGQVAQPPVRAVPGIPYLHLLCAGPAVDQPHRLIARNEFGRLLEILTPQFRAIFIDTPPASTGADAVTIALRASGALLVVRRHRARLDDQRELTQRLVDSTVEVVGAVINEFS